MTPALNISVNKGKSLPENGCTKDTVKMFSSQEVLGKNFTIYGTRENPLFLAKDVAEWIDHSDVSIMLRSVDEDEKLSKTNPNNVCGGQNAWFLTENGLYEVLMLSRKPIAKDFKREVKKILKGIKPTAMTFSQALRLAAERQERIELEGTV